MNDNKIMTDSSGNVFTDLNINPIAVLRLHFAHAIRSEINRRHLTHEQAAKLLGINAVMVSYIMRDKLNSFSVDRMVKFSTVLGIDVQLNLTAGKESVGQVILNFKNKKV